MTEDWTSALFSAPHKAEVESLADQGILFRYDFSVLKMAEPSAAASKSL